MRVRFGVAFSRIASNSAFDVVSNSSASARSTWSEKKRSTWSTWGSLSAMVFSQLAAQT